MKAIRSDAQFGSMGSITRRVKSALIAGRFALATRSRAVYFSIVLPEHVGFTDQTLLFGMLYKLGMHLGLPYHHRPLQPRSNLLQSESGDDYTWDNQGTEQYSGIYDYLGFDWHFSQRSAALSAGDASSIEFEFKKSHIEEQSIEDLSGLVDHLRLLILASLPAKGRPLHITLRIFSQFDAVRWLYYLPNSLLDFDYADIYRRYRELHPARDVFESDKPRVLLHIRQGDTAVIQTPWGSYMQAWHRGRDAFQERDSVAGIRDHQVITVADFERFYSDLKTGLAQFELATLVHSDGFARAFASLEQHSDRLNLSDEQLKALLDTRRSYNDARFEVFRQHPEVRQFVGEDLHLLFELVHAFYTCDVVIVGTQQRMFPKLYAYSFMDDSGPLVITLYKKQQPDYDYLGNTPMVAKCLYVDLENYEIAHVIEQVGLFLCARHNHCSPEALVATSERNTQVTRQ